MARPRVFLSSTYYDLKNIRSDIERFIKDQGYDAVLNEKGNIPYGKDEALEQYCYKEVDNCDILISIIGGRHGSTSQDSDKSISHLELNAALKQGKQIYIFIESSVFTEYRIYERNKEVENIQYTAVDSVSVFKFIEEVTSLPLNNNIAKFETSYDITIYLKEQWSGLFQRLLNENSRKEELVLIDNLRSTVNTLDKLVNFLTKEGREKDTTIKDILLSNHPAFDALKRAAQIPFRVFFTNFEELNSLLTSQGFMYLNELFQNNKSLEVHFWQKKQKDEIIQLYVNKEIFDENNKLIIKTSEEWSDKLINSEMVFFNDEENLDKMKNRAMRSRDLKNALPPWKSKPEKE